MAWIYLVLAGLCEVVWAVGLKKTEGFSRLWPSVYTLFFLALSFVLLARAMRALPVGTAYALWTGIGAVGAALVGILVLGEPKNAGRLLSLLLVVVGLLGLKYFSPEPKETPSAEKEAR